MDNERPVTREQIAAAQDPRSAATMLPESSLPPFTTEPRRAIGDLGPARRHVGRLIRAEMPLTRMALREMEASLDACVNRLEAMDAREAARQAETTAPLP